MKQKIASYKFDRILSDMGKEFGTIKSGNESEYESHLFMIERALLVNYRKNKNCNSRRTVEAIKICLYIIHGRINDIEYDLDEYLDENNSIIVDVLLNCFDPVENKELRKYLKKSKIDIKSKNGLWEYYQLFIKCLIRIEKSIEFWTKKRGITGYYDFIEESIGIMIDKNVHII